MPLLDDKVLAQSDGNAPIKETVIVVNDNNPFAQQDYSSIISTFEKESVDWAEEDYALATNYKDVYSTRNFSERVQEQLNHYPGLHQDTNMPTNDPSFKEAKQMGDERMTYWNNALDNPAAFMSGLRSRDQDFDYSKIFGSDTSAKTKAEQIGQVITKCIPCFERLLDMDGLVPSGDLLEVHLLNIKLNIDILDKILDLFRNPGQFVDICELLKLLSALCPQDLLALLALLTQYLAKLNLDFKFNLDFIINLIGPILSPFLDALSQWLDKWIQMLLAPILCVVDHINEVIYLAQTTKLAVQNASVDINGELAFNTALPFNTADGSYGLGIDTGASADGAWAEGEASRFSYPDSSKYKQYRPEWPSEEIQVSLDEMKRPEGQEPTEEEQANIESLKREQYERSKTLRQLPGAENGTKWSNNNSPLSDQQSASFSKGMENHPPEEQQKVQESDKYLDASPLVNSILQLRNIAQAAIRYVQDWFAYAVQMIYDLLGINFGWLLKKNDQSFIKSRLIQLILMIKSIIEAISKNGLRCGVDNNFDVPQMRFILEKGLNNKSATQFKVDDSGDIKVVPPSGNKPTVSGDTMSAEQSDSMDKQAGTSRNQDSSQNSGTVRNSTVAEEQGGQKIYESGIIVKNCLRNLTKEEINTARSWIADYERKLANA